MHGWVGRIECGRRTNCKCRMLRFYASNLDASTCFVPYAIPHPNPQTALVCATLGAFDLLRDAGSYAVYVAGRSSSRACAPRTH